MVLCIYSYFWHYLCIIYIFASLILLWISIILDKGSTHWINRLVVFFCSCTVTNVARNQCSWDNVDIVVNGQVKCIFTSFRTMSKESDGFGADVTLVTLGHYKMTWCVRRFLVLVSFVICILWELDDWQKAECAEYSDVGTVEQSEIQAAKKRFSNDVVLGLFRWSIESNLTERSWDTISDTVGVRTKPSCCLLPVLNPSSLESILVKSVSMDVRSAESLVLSKLPWLTVSRSLPSDKREEEGFKQETRAQLKKEHFAITEQRRNHYHPLQRNREALRTHTRPSPSLLLIKRIQGAKRKSVLCLTDSIRAMNDSH